MDASEPSTAPTERTYAQALRVIGRFLDREFATEFEIQEQPDGFRVRSVSPPRGAEQRDIHESPFQWDRLGDLDTFYTGGRGLTRRAGKHESALRKLGAQLDETGAHDLAVTARDSGLEVSQANRDTRIYGWDELT